MTTAIHVPELPRSSLPAEGWSGRLMTGTGTAIDATVLRAMRVLVERVLIPEPEDLESLRASASELIDTGLCDDPAAFFSAPAPADPHLEYRSEIRRRLVDGVVRDYEIQGSYQPYGFSDPLPSATTPLRVQRWIHDAGRGRGTVLTLHGFTMGYPRIDSVAMFANEWYRRGLDVALMTLPHHGARTHPDASFSGDRFAVPHVSRFAEAVREAVYEVQLLTRWLQGNTGRPVGLLGLSLGGYIAALAAGLDPDLDFVIPIAGPVCIGDLAWRFFSESKHHQDGVLPAFTRSELRASYRVHSPLAHPLRVDAKRVLIVAGRGDRIVPPEHPHALWEHWNRPAVHWFSGSHLAPFGRQKVVTAIAQHLAQLGIL